MNTNWRDQIASTPDVLRGKPRLKETRIPVSLILGYLAAGKTAQEIIAELPDLNETQIAACQEALGQLGLGAASPGLRAAEEVMKIIAARSVPQQHSIAAP